MAIWLLFIRPLTTKLRDVSEKQFCQLKSQLDGAVTRVHSDPSIEARFAVAFVASVLRTELRLTCEALELDVNEMIRKLDGAYLLRLPNGAYEEIHNHSTKCEELFKRLGLTMAGIKKFAEEVNVTKPEFSEVRKMPEVELRAGRVVPKAARIGRKHSRGTLLNRAQIRPWTSRTRAEKFSSANCCSREGCTVFCKIHVKKCIMRDLHNYSTFDF